MQDEYGANGLNGIGGAGFDHMMNDDFDDHDLSTSQINKSSLNVEYDPKLDEERQRLDEQKKYA